ncbi:MAG TPA: outer membrane beta-barrel protein, partial [Vicinamibacterales bacterium]
MRRAVVLSSFIILVIGAGARSAAAQAPAAQPSESPWVFDVGVGIQPSINGNVNSGVIGTLQGQTTAILPQSYGDVYGTGIEFHFGGGYALNEESELRGIFVYQSVDANLVRLGDIGASSLYGKYSDYKSLSLDLGYRRYVPVTTPNLRVYGEATVGIGFIDRINVQLAAPQSNTVFNNTDFYDGTATFTMSINAGVLFRVAEQVDLNAQIGLRRLSGLADVDQLVGTGLE